MIDLYISMLIMAVIGVVIIVIWQGGSTLDHLAALFHPHAQSIWQGIALAVAGQLYIWLAHRIRPFHLPATREMVSLNEVFRTSHSAHILSVSLVTAVSEEILFRAAILGLLAAWLGGPVGCLIVTIVFGLSHLPQYRGGLHALLYVLVLGLALNILFLYHGNLWGPIIAHFINNALNFWWLKKGYLQLSSRDSSPNSN